MANKDLYHILGVAESASEQEIKDAFRELAKKYHPDKHRGDKRAEERFKEIAAAYDVLGDPKKRAQYDQMRRYGGDFSGNFHNMNFDDLGTFFSSGFRGQRAAGGGLGDLFNQFFGGSGGFSSRSQKGQDIAVELTIPFDTAVTGGKQVVSVNGQRISLNIPAGSEEGKKIRLRGQGKPGFASGAAGDLIITLHVAPHPQFRRQGADIYSTVAINFVQAALGSKVAVTTYDKGTVSLKIPPGTAHGKLFKLKSMGIEVDGITGDHYVEIAITVPTHLDARAQKALKEFAAAAALDY